MPFVVLVEEARNDIELSVAVSGVRPECETLYAAHAGDLARYLRRLVRDPETAADLVQETFVRAMSARRVPEAEEKIRPWLFRIASNLAVSHLRRARLRALLRLDPAPPAPATLDEAEHVRLALRSIPPEQAVTLVLALHQGLNRREVAALLGVSEEAIKSRLARGRLNFAAAYRRLDRGLA